MCGHAVSTFEWEVEVASKLIPGAEESVDVVVLNKRRFVAWDVLDHER